MELEALDRLEYCTLKMMGKEEQKKRKGGNYLRAKVVKEIKNNLRIHKKKY